MIVGKPSTFSERPLYSASCFCYMPFTGKQYFSQVPGNRFNYSFKICESFAVENHSTCSSIGHLPLTWTTDHRSHSLPVQWIHVWDTHSLHRLRPRGPSSPQRPLFRGLAMHEAYLPLPGPCLLCLSPPSLLSESKLELLSHYHLPNPVL